jgi:serine/threonine protein kinase
MMFWRKTNLGTMLLWNSSFSFYLHDQQQMTLYHWHFNSKCVFFRNFEIIKRVAYEISLALAYLNKQNIVHRSLSLENILLDATVFSNLCNSNKFTQPPLFYCLSKVLTNWIKKMMLFKPQKNWEYILKWCHLLSIYLCCVIFM